MILGRGAQAPLPPCWGELPLLSRNSHPEAVHDSLIYAEFKKKIDKRKIPMIQMMRDEALKAFELWDKKADKVKY